MRNLLQYPITAEEVIETIKTKIQKELDLPYADRPCGSIDLICLNIASQFLIEREKELQSFLETKQQETKLKKDNNE